MSAPSHNAQADAAPPFARATRAGIFPRKARPRKARPRNAEQRLLVALRVPFCDALGSDPLALSRLSSPTDPDRGDSAHSIKNAGRSTLRSAFHQSFANSA